MEERMAWNGSGDVHVATAERWSDGFSRSLDTHEFFVLKG